MISGYDVRGQTHLVLQCVVKVTGAHVREREDSWVSGVGYGELTSKAQLGCHDGFPSGAQLQSVSNCSQPPLGSSHIFKSLTMRS